jgi:DNA-binding MarR family transcriptional regulator
MDSFEACTNELISFVRAAKRLTHVPVDDGPALDRPALMLLFGAVEHGPVRPSALADSLHLDLSTVSRQVAGLENSGWVARERDPDDRRAFLVRATDEGRRVLSANLAARRALLKDLLTDWSEGERLEFARLLGLLNKTLEQRGHAPVCPAAEQEMT